VNEPGTLQHSGKRRRRADGRVPDGRGEHQEQNGNSQIRGDPAAPNDHEQQEDGCRRNENEIKYQQQECAQMTLCSGTS